MTSLSLLNMNYDFKISVWRMSIIDIFIFEINSQNLLIHLKLKKLILHFREFKQIAKIAKTHNLFLFIDNL